MPLLKADTTIDLSEIPEVDLVSELYNRGIDLNYITSAYYALEEMEGHRLDELLGYSEEGLHGRSAK